MTLELAVVVLQQLEQTLHLHKVVLVEQAQHQVLMELLQQELVVVAVEAEAGIRKLET